MTLSPDQNPEPVFPKDLLVSPPPGQPWYVAQVKSRREKALATFLHRHGTAYYLPLMKKRQAENKRVRYSLVPVFSGYVFVNTGLEGRYNAFRSNHVSRMIEVTDPDILLFELAQIHHALSADKPVYPVGFLSAGRRVRIRKGPMKDIEGIIVRKDKRYRLILSVTSIMQSISLEIDADMVEPA